MGRHFGWSRSRMDRSSRRVAVAGARIGRHVLRARIGRRILSSRSTCRDDVHDKRKIEDVLFLAAGGATYLSIHNHRANWVVTEGGGACGCGGGVDTGVMGVMAIYLHVFCVMTDGGE